MESKNKNVINIGRNDLVAVARQTGMTDFKPVETRRQFSDDREVSDDHSLNTPRVPRKLIAIGLTAVAAATTAWIAGPRSHDAPQPNDTKTFAEQAADSAKVSGNSAEDFVVNGIRVKTNDPNRNTPSEAVLNDPRVKAYEQANPDEVTSITASAMALPGGKELGIVMRDVNHDGEKDAIAVEIKK